MIQREKLGLKEHSTEFHSSTCGISVNILACALYVQPFCVFAGLQDLENMLNIFDI